MSEVTSEATEKKVSEKVESHEKRTKALKIVARMAKSPTVYQRKVIDAVMEQLGIKFPLAYYYVVKVGAQKGFLLPKKAPKVEKKAKVKKVDVSVDAQTVTPDGPMTSDTAYMNGLNPNPLVSETQNAVSN